MLPTYDVFAINYGELRYPPPRRDLAGQVAVLHVPPRE
jgi:hypothetical protein